MDVRSSRGLARRALSFATQAHGAIDQRRKYTGDAYIVHPVAVARLVAQVPGHTEEMLAAAYLHDVVEDTRVRVEEIRDRFGVEVAGLVQELTSPRRAEDGNRAARKAAERERWASASPQAKTIKLADIIDNALTIVRHDPVFARVYLVEIAALLEVLKEGGDPALFARADSLVQAGLQRLGVLPGQ